MSKAKKVVSETLVPVEFDGIQYYSLDELHNLLLSRVNAAHVAAAGLGSKINTALGSVFWENGGCPACDGRGTIVVWDTLDCMDGSCAEFGMCKNPACTAETRTISGINLGFKSKHDKWRGLNIDKLREEALAKNHSELAEEYNRARDVASNLEFEIRKLAGLPLVPGSVVKVHKGRNAVGTVGCVAAVKSFEWGPKLLIKPTHKYTDRSVQGIWISPVNVRHLLTEDQLKTLRAEASLLLIEEAAIRACG